mgnify:CR=1 FL=1
MKKVDFIEKIKENINKPGGVLGAITDPNQMKLINTNLDSIQKKLQAMGMMEEDIAEALNMGKDYNDQTEFFRDMIDNLMHRYYGVTYYNPAVDEKPIKPSEPEKPEDSQQLSLFPKEKKVESQKRNQSNLYHKCLIVNIMSLCVKELCTVTTIYSISLTELKTLRKN